jgi:hypothetical protein
MKSAVLIAAMLSGLCAEAVAAPMGEQPRPVPAALEDIFTRPTIERDLGFLAGSGGETLRDEDRPELIANLIANDLGSGEAIGQDEFVIDEERASRSLGTPGAPLLAAIALGLSCLGIFAFCCQSRRERRRSGRRGLRQNGEWN